MITDQDIKKLKTIFATKADLKRFATKDDLKRFATKEDLKQYATKEDLKQYATKEDLRKNTDLILRYIDHRLEPLDSFQKEFTEFKDRVYETLDWLVGSFKTFHEEHAILTAQYSSINERLEALEKKQPPNKN